jgi:hypothetical protein
VSCILYTAPLVTVFAKFAKGVLAGSAIWWLGKIYIVTLAAPVRIKKNIVLLDMLRLSISTVFGKGYIVTLAVLASVPVGLVEPLILSTVPLWY